MLRSAKELLGYTIRAIDGDIGQVDDFYFDDKTWVIRYVAVDTGGWLSGRKVLVSPVEVAQPDWSQRVLPVNLNKDEIEDSPSIDLEKPVSRQHEVKLGEYYGWPNYWSAVRDSWAPRRMPAHFGPVAPTMTTMPAPVNTPETSGEEGVLERKEWEKVEESSYDPHLRSMEEIIGYDIEARDGEIGHVETFIVDDKDWSIMYLVVDTRDWLPGKKVLTALSWVESLNWTEQCVHIDLEKEMIKNGPEYDSHEPINRETEMTLYDYYGRPVYWQK